MKRISKFMMPLCLVFFLFSYNFAYAGALKWIRVGRYWTKVIDSGDQGESSGEGTFGYYYYDGFTSATLDAEGWEMGCAPWIDKENKEWAFKVSGAGYCTADELIETMPVPDEEKITIHKYVRFQPPTVTVDGYRLDEPFPLTPGDEVAPDKIPGTADVMVESLINTSMGVTVHQKVLGWSQKNHDDYMIFDWTLTNTGIVDLEGTVVEQTLNEFYFMRITRHRAGGSGRVWCSAYGEYEGDSLRIVYSYPRRSEGATYDEFGIRTGWKKIAGKWKKVAAFKPLYIGEAMLHVDESADIDSDDLSQPQMTSVYNSETPWQRDDPSRWGPVENGFKYHAMQFGLVGVNDGLPDAGPYITGVSPDNGTPVYEGTHHTQRHDHMGLKFIEDFPWYSYDLVGFTSSGPYTLEPGEDIRIVWATVNGSISPEKATEVYEAWEDGTLLPPAGFELGVTDNLPPQYKLYPSLYEADDKADEKTNWAKDCWVASGKDSLFNSAGAAQWNVRIAKYEVPMPPPPPSVTVTSMPDMIVIEWGKESESDVDLAGYRVYRALGAPYYSKVGDVVLGKWERIFECGKGTNKFDDTDATGVKRGMAYYYYVTAFDKGEKTGIYGKEVLESGQYLNMTTRPAHLTREPGAALSDIRVVPNPFNIIAADLQFLGEPDKIMFLNLPMECTIKIYTESGDLIKTIEHYGSGDEAWGVLEEEHSATETGQIIVSGIYIAYIETPDGENTFVKFVVVR